MDICLRTQHKSLTPFAWIDVPRFAVIAGRNGAGKSQLLDWLERDAKHDGADDDTLSEDLQVIRLHPGHIATAGTATMAAIRSDVNQAFQGLQAYIAGAAPNELRTREGELAFTEDRQRAFFDYVVDTIGPEPHRDEFVGLLSSSVVALWRHRNVSYIFLLYAAAHTQWLAASRSEGEFVNRFGSPPWDRLNAFARRSGLPYEFTSPDLSDPSRYEILPAYGEAFQMKAKRRDSRLELQFAELSDGERQLLSAILWVYEAEVATGRETLFVVDEPDASLHPEWSRPLLHLLAHDLAGQHGHRVIMTTHSTATVALTPAGSLFEMTTAPTRITGVDTIHDTVSRMSGGLVQAISARTVLVEGSTDEKFYNAVARGIAGLRGAHDIAISFVAVDSALNAAGKGSVEAAEKLVSFMRDADLPLVVGTLRDRDGTMTGGESAASPMTSRYCVENYLVDPLVVFGKQLEISERILVGTREYRHGQQYSFRTEYGSEDLQDIADSVLSCLESRLRDEEDWDDRLRDRKSLRYLNGPELQYPNWLFEWHGKRLLSLVHAAYDVKQGVNLSGLQKTLLAMELYPMDLVEDLDQLRVL